MESKKFTKLATKARPRKDHPDPEFWSIIRQKVFDRDKICVTCSSSENLECHHRAYDRFGKEDLEDLVTLCTQCHEAITSDVRRRRYAKRNHRPVPMEEPTRYGYPESRAKAGICVPTDSPQWTNGKSVLLGYKGPKRYFQEEE